MNYNPFYPSLNVGNPCDYSHDGESFGYGCAYVCRVVDIIYPDDGFGVYTYLLKSDLPMSQAFEAHPSQVKKKDCHSCNYTDCKFHNHN